MHQTNGGFVYVGLNAKETTYGAACIFYCINQDKYLQQILYALSLLPDGGIS